MWKDIRICTNKELSKAISKRKTLVIPQLTDDHGNIIQEAVYTWEVLLEENIEK